MAAPETFVVTSPTVTATVETVPRIGMVDPPRRGSTDRARDVRRAGRMFACSRHRMRQAGAPASCASDRRETWRGGTEDQKRPDHQSRANQHDDGRSAISTTMRQRRVQFWRAALVRLPSARPVASDALRPSSAGISAAAVPAPTAATTAAVNASVDGDFVKMRQVRRQNRE